VSELDGDARSLFGLRKQAPRRPLSTTIILALVLAFLFLSGPRDLDEDSAVAQARVFVAAVVSAQCGHIAAIPGGHISHVTNDSGKLERFEIELLARLSNGKDVVVQVHVWPGIRIGPRLPLGAGQYTALFVFKDGVEISDGEVSC